MRLFFATLLMLAVLSIVSVKSGTNETNEQPEPTELSWIEGFESGYNIGTTVGVVCTAKVLRKYKNISFDDIDQDVMAGEVEMCMEGETWALANQ